jgi:5-methylcytosine-specific restriction endonuclease McrA
MSIRASSKRIKELAEQTIHIQDPPTTSRASLVLLYKLYSKYDKTLYKESRMSKIRNRWMKMLMKTPDEKGGLTCSICGKKGLLPVTPHRDKLATLDHIVELKYNGEWADPHNFRVACYLCNTRRTS